MVVGGGAVGLAAAWHAARRGRAVHLLERFRIGHERGSSAGLERQWRIQYSEEQWSRLALDTLPLWRALESAAARPLLHQTGSLWFGRPGVATSEGELRAAAGVLDSLGVDYSWLSAAEIEARFGFARLSPQHEGFHQADGGVIDVKGTLDALRRLCLEAGVRLHEQVRVRAVEPDASGVTVRTDCGDHRADTAVVSAGAFANELLAPLGHPLELRRFRMTSAYFARRVTGGADAAHAGVDLPTWYAFLEPDEGQGGGEGANRSYYGFGVNPWTGGGLLRAAPDTELPLGDADPADRAPADAELLRRTADWVGRHLPGLAPAPLYPSSCLAALPADPARQFYLGSLAGEVPDGERVVVQAGGWAFKFVPAFGRICADLALDGSSRHAHAALALR